jgi:peptidoglycan/LPS O-acetylase OafA/YrhL
LQAGRKVELTSYFLRRITRLEPPYILWLLVRSTLLLATAFLPFHVVLVHLLASIFYVHNIAFGIASRIEAVSWTLEIEVQFYCLVPLLTLLFKIPKAALRRALMLLLIAGAAPLQRAFIPGWEGPQNFGAFQLSILAEIQFFMVGLLVADLYVDGWQRIPSSWKWDVLCIPLWILFFWLEPHAFLFAAPIILPFVIVGGFKGSLIRKFLSHPVVSTIGGMCYSIYLTHRTIITLMQRLFAPLHLGLYTELVISLTLIAPVSIALASLYFLLVERPCMDPRWPAKLMARLRTGRTRPPLADPAS